MSQNPLLEVLAANRWLRSPDEVIIFEQTLAKLAQNPDSVDLPGLHLILDDACQHPEVMFSLVHFLESFEVQTQVQAFIQVLPDLVKQAAAWTAILHARMMNEAIARATFEKQVQSRNVQEQNHIWQLLALAADQLASTQTPKVA